MKYLLSILCLIIFSCDSDGEVEGCTDVDACNFNADATIDDNVTCYYRDVEGVCYDIVSEISLNMPDWKKSSQPISDLMYSQENRFDLFLYNPYNEVNTIDIWEDIEVTTTADNQKTRTLWLELDTEHLYLDENMDEEYWAGINYHLLNDDKNQSQKKYLDIWMNTTVSEDLIFHIDLGILSEDINDSGQQIGRAHV